MMTIATHARRNAGLPSDVVLEVPREDEECYARHSYHDLMHVWNDLVCELAEARRTGDAAMEARLHGELRHFWPHADEVADAPWVPEQERELALPSDET